MVDDVWLATPLVVIVKVAVFAPKATVTLAGTCAVPVLLLERVTTAPAGGAARFSVTVPGALLPPMTELGVLVTDDKAAALTVSVALALTPKVAVITDVVED